MDSLQDCSGPRGRADMTGRELYRLYEQAFYKNDVIVDTWDELDGSDQQAWSDMAESLPL